MNKYQEALNRLIGITHNFPFKEWQKKDNKEMKELLQELVDKENPMKPVKVESPTGSIYFICDNCSKDTVDFISSNGKINLKFDRCINKTCGQAIDWSNDNE